MLHRPHRRQAPRRALITGASSGIGSAFARALPQTDLLLAGRNEAALQELADQLGTSTSRKVSTVVGDLVEPEGRASVINAADMFEIDLLVNNAGMGTFGPFTENQPAREESTVLVNVLAPVALARGLLPGMIKRAEAAGQRCGLINVASSLALTPVPYGAIYAASKAFVLSFSEALAAELSRQPVDILAVCPGPVRTDFFRRAGFPGGSLPGAQDPNQVARRALAALGVRNVAFTDVANALTFRAIADLRMTVSRGLALGIGTFRAFQRQRNS